MNTPNLSTIPISLDAIAHEIAQGFYQHQTDIQKAKQIYLNTLAVYAVNYYLNSLNIKTDLQNSDSWNIVMQSLSDVADLMIKNRGKIECRPVLPQSKFCYIPTEVWSDRLGYIAVQFNQDLTEANLLGYVPEVTTENFPINQLQPLDELIVCLSKTPVVNLSQWLENIFEEGWVALNTLLIPQQQQPSFRSRSIALKTSHWIKQAKIIYLDSLDKSIALGIILKPTNSLDLDIWVDIYPLGNELSLPSGLELVIINEEGTEVMKAKIQDDNQRIQFNFLGHVGDHFSIRISIGEFSFTQPFVV